MEERLIFLMSVQWQHSNNNNNYSYCCEQKCCLRKKKKPWCVLQASPSLIGTPVHLLHYEYLWIKKIFRCQWSVACCLLKKNAQFIMLLQVKKKKSEKEEQKIFSRRQNFIRLRKIISFVDFFLFPHFFYFLLLVVALTVLRFYILKKMALKILATFPFDENYLIV